MNLSILLAVFTLSASPKDSLSDLVQKVTDLESAKRAHGVEVVLAPGRYQVPKEGLKLTEASSGAKGAPVIWRAAEPGTVVWTQASEIPLTKFRVAEGFTNKVLVADLSGMGFNLGTAQTREETYPLSLPEVYVDGVRMLPAKWPNTGWSTIAQIVDGGTKVNSGAATDVLQSVDASSKEPPRGATLEVGADAAPRLASWAKEKDLRLHGYWCYDWYSSVQLPDVITASNKTIRLKFPHVYGVRMGNPQPRRYQVVNALCELDVPGECYVDREKSLLYLCPPVGFSPKSRVTLADCSCQDTLTLEDVSNVIFRGISFEDCFKNAATLLHCSRVGFDGCTFHSIREQAVHMYDCTRCVVRSCTVEHTGHGGVHLEGGDRKLLIPASNRVENCRFRWFSDQRQMYSPAITLAGVGNIARHNEMTDAPQMACAISGNDHIFEYNVISNMCQETDDAGALYKGRNPSCRGNIIRYNLWQDIGSPKGSGTAAIYFDDGDSGDKVIGNIFIRCGVPGNGNFATVFSHGGYSNRVENCIFMDCKRALGSSPWDQERWKASIMDPYWQNLLRKVVDITSPVYLQHYPELANFFGPHPDEQRWNSADNNVFINCGSIFTNRWAIGKSNFVLKKHPSPALPPLEYPQLPSFQPIPLERIGRMTDK